MLGSGKGLSAALILCSCLPLLFLVPGGPVGDLRPLGKCELPCKLVEKAGFWSCSGEGFPQSSSGCVGLGESSVELWPNLSWHSPLSDLRASPHTSMCLSACWRTHRPSVHSVGGTLLVLAPTEGSASSLEPVCALSPNRPQPRPLWLQELALPCNVLILIKVQTGFYFGGRGGGAQVWDEKGTAALPHPYCMPPPSFYFSHLQLKIVHFTDITHTYLTGAGHPASALGKDSQRTTLSPRCPS